MNFVTIAALIALAVVYFIDPALAKPDLYLP
jgi:hypothetical protein